MKPLKKSLTLAAAAALLMLLPAGAVIAPLPAMLEAKSDTEFIVDVAIDGRTFGFDDITVTDVTLVRRGTTFIVSGPIYPAGTLPEGGTPDVPSPVGPDTPGRIGTWVCRGTFNIDFADILAGAAPHVTSTQFFYFDDGRMLVTDGPEGGMLVQRAVLGGTGGHAGLDPQYE